VEPAAIHQKQPRRWIRQRLVDRIVGAILGLPVDRVAGKADELARLAQRRVKQAEAHVDSGALGWTCLG